MLSQDLTAAFSNHTTGYFRFYDWAVKKIFLKDTVDDFMYEMLATANNNDLNFIRTQPRMGKSVAFLIYAIWSLIYKDKTTVISTTVDTGLNFPFLGMIFNRLRSAGLDIDESADIPQAFLNSSSGSKVYVLEKNLPEIKKQFTTKKVDYLIVDRPILGTVATPEIYIEWLAGFEKVIFILNHQDPIADLIWEYYGKYNHQPPNYFFPTTSRIGFFTATWADYYSEITRLEEITSSPEYIIR